MENFRLQPQPFAFDVYTQLGQVQRDIGSLTANQQAMAEQLRQHEVQMRDSESRIIHALNQFEVRVTARIDKVESDLSERIQSTESNLSTLRDRVSRAFWATAGGGVVLGMALGWKPILGRVASFLGA
ncbi:hypothetical protein [Cupriavidus sp. BIS7]|uniref:hypothetical protein n=1 Tax=Cupriavidus sp. BIS7 TaxID=1217718 RepID=UPI0002F5B6C2|nr:hypothetical protein [Cupriavidus sp. BIS7]